MTRIEPDLLNALWTALNATPRAGLAKEAKRVANRIAEEGWGHLTDIEDMVLAFDSRAYEFDLKRLASYLELPVRHLFNRPRFLNSNCLGFEAMSAVDTAALLIFLAELGFNVDPSSMVEALLPSLEGRKQLTFSELDILRYGMRRGRRLLEVRSQDQGPGKLEVQKLRTVTGCRVEAILRDGRPIKLVTKGGNYRAKPEPQPHTCEYCGMEYMRGDPEENASHLSYHAQIRRVQDPWPLSDFLLAMATEADPELVRPNSKVWKHREVYARARQFRREMGFDFVQWECNRKGKEADPYVHGFLFGDDTGTFPRGTIVGACAFRWREDHWGLQWIWINPQVRRKGVLARRWGRYVEHFGDFEVEAPLSASMSAFVRRYGTPEQQRSLGQAPSTV